jgi:hypothetical protein
MNRQLWDAKPRFATRAVGEQSGAVSDSGLRFVSFFFRYVYSVLASDLHHSPI